MRGDRGAPCAAPQGTAPPWVGGFFSATKPKCKSVPLKNILPPKSRPLPITPEHRQPPAPNRGTPRHRPSALLDAPPPFLSFVP